MTVTATRNFILLSQSLTINKKKGQPGDGLLDVLALYKPGPVEWYPGWGLQRRPLQAPGCAASTTQGPDVNAAHRRTSP